MISKQLLSKLKKYIENKTNKVELSVNESELIVKQYCKNIYLDSEIENYISNNRKPSFKNILFNFIDKKGFCDSKVYKNAGIDRRLFSKIRSIHNYKPSKKTVVALGLALKLNKKEMDLLLKSSGYTLSENDTFDLIIQFCIINKIYNINDVNIALDYYNLKPLTGTIK